MSSSEQARLQSIRALTDLKSGIQQYSVQANEAMAEMEIIIQRTLHWLDEREHYWKRETRHRQPIFEAAERLWKACQQANARQKNPNSCQREHLHYLQAKNYFFEAVTALNTVHKWKQIIDQSAADYRRQAYQLKSVIIGSELPKAVGYLDQKITLVQNYKQSGGSSVGQVYGGGSTSISQDYSQTREQIASAAAKALLGEIAAKGTMIAFASVTGTAAPLAAVKVAKGALTGYFEHKRSGGENPKDAITHITNAIIEEFIPYQGFKNATKLTSIGMIMIGESQLSAARSSYFPVEGDRYEAIRVGKLAIDAGNKLDLSQRISGVHKVAAQGSITKTSLALANETVTFFSGGVDTLKVGWARI